jgi:hypothetical protein
MLPIQHRKYLIDITKPLSCIPIQRIIPRGLKTKSNFPSIHLCCIYAVYTT